MSKKIRWAILGTSYISEVMASAIQSSDHGELVAVGSRSPKTASNFADKFAINKILHPEHLLSDKDIDAVYIGLPNHLHKEWMIRCAQAGKHILCEKPFVLNSQEAEEVFTAVKKANVFCMEALMYRCHPFTQKIIAAAHSDDIGKIKLIQACYTADIVDVANPIASGSIRNLGCYPMSLVRLVMGSEPITLTGYRRKGHQTDNDRQASAIATFQNDAIAVISTADDMKMRWQFEVHGDRGHLKLISNPWLPDQTDNRLLIYRNGNENPTTITMTADKPLYTYQIDIVSQHILQGKQNAEHSGVSWNHTLGNVKTLDAWLEC